MLHPAEIAREFRTYPFFASFDEALLLQMCTMVRVADFKAGSTILQAKQMNNTLYILREGIIDVLVDGEQVNVLTKAGEVLGEMSVLSGLPVSADIKARTDVKCYSINADDFSYVHPNQKDLFKYILYKVYSVILTDRLLKTNEKAKLYEITARELAIKKRELETVTAAQMNFLRAEATNTKKALLLEPVKKQQNIIKTAVGSTGVELLIANTIEEAQSLFAENLPDVIFCDGSSSDFLSWAKDQNYQGQSVLIESGNMDFRRIQSFSFVPTVISRNPEDRPGTVKGILTTLSKILHDNYFGPEKYLAWGTDIRKQRVTGSKDRAPLIEQMSKHFKSLGVRSSILDRVQLAVEEMMMNAVYDAPVDREGHPLFNHLPRTTEVNLQGHQAADFSYGSDGNFLAVSIQDPFGALPRDVILQYLDTCYNGQAGSLNSKKGGAGRGLHQILESCDWTVFNVKPGARTEVIGLFDIEQKRDGQPQFHYFFIK